MKQTNNTKSEVYLSTYDESDILLPVSEEHKGLQNICVAVKFGDIIIKISPRNTCECSWHETMENHADDLTHPAYWQMVGSVYYEVNQAIEMLGQELLRWIWTDTEDNDPHSSGYRAWIYLGSIGFMGANLKYRSLSVRATKVFKI